MNCDTRFSVFKESTQYRQTDRMQVKCPIFHFIAARDRHHHFRFLACNAMSRWWDGGRFFPALLISFTMIISTAFLQLQLPTLRHKFWPIKLN